MSLNHAEWLAGYRYFKQQYIARNEAYCEFYSQLDALKKRYKARNLPAKFSFSELTDNLISSRSEMIEYFTNKYKKELSDDDWKHVTSGVAILKEIYALGGERWTEFGDKSDFMLAELASNEKPYWTVDDIWRSYHRAEGTMRMSCGITGRVKLGQIDENEATCIVRLDEPLDLQFNNLKKYLEIMAAVCKKEKTDEESDETERRLHELENESYKIEYNGVRRNKQVSYSTKGDIARCIGIWLFDYCEENSCGGPTSISAFRQTKHCDDLGLASKEDREFERWLAGTRRCIEAREVLALT